MSKLPKLLFGLVDFFLYSFLGLVLGATLFCSPSVGAFSCLVILILIARARRAVVVFCLLGVASQAASFCFSEKLITESRKVSEFLIHTLSQALGGSLVRLQDKIYRANITYPPGVECVVSAQILPLATHELVVVPSTERLRAGEGLSGKMKILSNGTCPEVVPTNLGVSDRLFDAIWLGKQEAISPEWWEYFNRLGLSHLIVVSGSHLSLVAGGIILFLILILRRISVRRGWLWIRGLSVATVLALLALWPMEVPLLRAGLAFLSRELLVMLWPRFYRIAASEWTMGVGVVLGVLFPTELLTKSFLFSFGAAWSLLRASESVGSNKFLSMLAPTLAVPIFGQVWCLESNPMALFLSLPMILFFSVILMPALFLKSVLGFFPNIVERFCQKFIYGCEILSEFSRETFPCLSYSFISMLFALFGSLLLLRSRKFGLSHKIFGLTAIYCFGLLPDFGRIPDHKNEVHVLDVGQGDGILLKLDGKSILIDGGDRADLVSQLRSRGVSEIDLWILSHYDRDHIRSPLENLHRIEMKEIWIPDWDHSKTSKQLAINSSRVRSSRETSLEYDLPHWTLRASSPALTKSANSRIKNPHSLCLSLFDRFGRRLGVFLGDLDANGERAFLLKESHQPERLAILKVAHHGSGSSTIDELIATLQPEIAIISAGRTNSYGHPHPRVIDRLQRWGADIMSTSWRGGFILDLDRYTKDHKNITVIQNEG